MAGDADPTTGLLALLNQQLLKPVGFLTPLLYGSLAGKGVCRGITIGNTGAYTAGPGWGSPQGT